MSLRSMFPISIFSELMSVSLVEALPFVSQYHQEVMPKFSYLFTTKDFSDNVRRGFPVADETLLPTETNDLSLNLRLSF